MSAGPINRPGTYASQEAGQNAANYFGRDTIANRPAASSANLNGKFWATDLGILYESNGIIWREIACTDTPRNDSILIVPPAYMQTSSDTAVTLSSANHGVEFSFALPGDLSLSSVAWWLKTLTESGNINISLCSEDGTSICVDGDYNGLSTANIAPTMTTDALPSPNAVAATSETAGFEAYKALDGLTTSDDGWRSTAAPSAGSPQSWVWDCGSGNSKTINVVDVYAINDADANVRAFPTTRTWWGSNLVSPNKDNDVDWVQINGAHSLPFTASDPGAASFMRDFLSNGTAYRWIRCKVTARSGTNNYTSVGLFKFYTSESHRCGGTQLASLATVSCGTAGHWNGATIAMPYQMQRNTRLVLRFTGSAGANFALSENIWNTGPGCAFPDLIQSTKGVFCRYTTDNWVTFSVLRVNSVPAMLNVIINPSSTYLSPQLFLCRGKGDKIYLPASGATPGTTVIIPPEGILVPGIEDLSGNTLATILSSPETAVSYTVYAYDNNGLTAEASAVASTINEGVEVKAGYTNHRKIGVFWPVERQTGKQAPIDVSDARGLAWLGRKVSWRRHNPYNSSTAVTSEYIYATNDFTPWMKNDDWTVFVGVDGGAELIAEMYNVNASQGSQERHLGLAINGTRPFPWQSRPTGLANSYTTGSLGRFTQKLRAGCHVLRPLNAASASGLDVMYFPGSPYYLNPRYRAAFFGWLEP